jgi:xanthine/uracil permease
MCITIRPGKGFFAMRMAEHWVGRGGSVSMEPELTYALNDLPPWPKNLLYALQWALIFLPTLTIIATISISYLGFQPAEALLFFQRMLVITGAMMILQTLWGHRFPLLDGPSSALLLGFVILAPQGIPAIQGGMAIGGLFLLLLSALGWMRRLEPLFTDNVVGVILILIAVTLLPYLGPMIIQKAPGQAGEGVVLAISLAVMIAVALFSHWFRGFPKTVSLFLGMILGTVLMAATGRASWPDLAPSPWLSVPHPFFYGLPKFSFAAIVSFLFAYLAVIVNEVGSIYSVGEVVGKSDMGRRVNRGIGVTGLGGLLAGGCGVIGTVSFGVSPGVILVTRVGSRFAVTVCGLILCGLGFSGKVLTLFSAIPASVAGAAMMTGLAAQIGVGISVLTRSGRVLDGRDYLIIGIPILLGGIVPFLPDAFLRSFPAEFQALLKNGMVAGILSVLLLEHLLLRVKSK